MLRWKEILSLKIRSAENIAVLCWCGTILAGNLPVAMKTGNYIDLPFNCAFLAVLFLIQLATAVILGNCYDKTEPSLHRKILITNWCHSIQITFYHSFAIKLFSFAGLPGRKNNLPAWDDRRTRKALSPKTDAEDLNSFKSSS